MIRLEQLYLERQGARHFAGGYLEHLTALLRTLDTEAIGAFIQTLLEARARGARIFFIGNGGSAASASHFANDISVGCQGWERPFSAMSLTDNVSILTAVANDYGYEHVFTMQLRSQMTAGDVVVAISASGNSPNVVQAIEYANVHGAMTVALTGFDGGRLKQIAGQCVHVATGRDEYGPVEDVHMILNHLVGGYLKSLCRAENEKRATL